MAQSRCDDGDRDAPELHEADRAPTVRTRWGYRVPFAATHSVGCWVICAIRS